MAKVSRLNTLISNTERMTVADAYELFMQSRKLSCAVKTCKIYEDLGRRATIPILAELTNNNIYNVDADILRELFAQYKGK